MSRLIDADELPEHKFTRESAKGSDYMRGWNDAIDAIIDNAPTVDTDIVPLMQDIVANIPKIVDKAVKLYIEERRRENEQNNNNP